MLHCYYALAICCECLHKSFVFFLQTFCRCSSFVLSVLKVQRVEANCGVVYNIYIVHVWWPTIVWICLVKLKYDFVFCYAALLPLFVVKYIDLMVQKLYGANYFFPCFSFVVFIFFSLLLYNSFKYNFFFVLYCVD